MDSDLTVVKATDSGCVIGRDASGAYVVCHSLQPSVRRRVATLECAYATCRDWERQASPAGGPEPIALR